MESVATKNVNDYKEITSKYNTLNMESLNAFDIKTFDYNKTIANLLANRYDFMTGNSKDVSLRLINMAEGLIDRAEHVVKLSNLFNNIHKALKLELGIFEYSLTHVTINSLADHFVENTYTDKFNDILGNLDTENKFIQNKTLFPSLQKNQIDPQIVAFLSPSQLHPERWLSCLNKKRKCEEMANNMATTDIEQCGNCGDRKAKITQLQIRGADEPMTTFITCLTCYSTVTRN
jgi:DNA-directed RNA polymerase subunit M/transcription elongation factor TFIIS